MAKFGYSLNSVPIKVFQFTETSMSKDNNQLSCITIFLQANYRINNYSKKISN